MANDNKEIGDIVKKCKILLLDIEGTTTSISFVKDKLFPYAEENVKEFLNDQWETSDVKEAVAALRKLAIEDEEKSVEGLVAIPGESASKEDQIQGLVNNVKWQMSCDRKAGPLKNLQGLIWKQGFDKGDIKGHVYDDVSAALEQWHKVEGQKVYIYSSGSVQAQKLLFGKSVAGDLMPFIDGYFDTAVGPKQEAASYTAIVEEIGAKADEILFLTDIPKEAEAATSAGMQAALVSREGDAPAAAIPVIHSLAQLAVSHKRKTEPQDEQPAKIPKTDTSSNIKDVVETQIIKKENSSEILKEGIVNEKLEKMDVDEEIAQEDESTKAEPTVIEEVTDSKAINAPTCDANPVVIEASDVPQIEEMETESIETLKCPNNVPAENVTVENKKKTEDVPKEEPVSEKPVQEKALIAEETPPTTITKIEEITSDKENLADMADVDDIKPVVEEPKIEDLENAGQELEKECDDILTKVQNVTNLDSILLRQVLKPIAEESAESDNEPLSESILEKEIAAEAKTSEQIESTLTESINPKSKVSTNETETNVEIAEVVNDGVESSKVKSNTEKEKDESAVEKTDSVTDEALKNTDKSDLHNEKLESTEVTQKTETKEEKTEIRATKTNVVEKGIKESNVKVEVSLEQVPAEKETDTQNNTSVEKPAGNSSKNVESPMEGDETKTIAEVKSNESSKEDKPNNVETKDTTEEKPKERKEQLNGKTNGEAEANLNGDASNNDLSTRLAVENSNKVNGANGNSQDEAKQLEKKEQEIKVKSVSADDTTTEPVEQPTEA